MRIKVLSTFGRVSSTTIPLENFLSIENSVIQKIVVDFTGQNEASRNLLKALYGIQEVSVHGIDSRIPGGTIIKFAMLLWKYQPHVIHNHHSKASLVGAILGRVFTKAAIIQTIHNDFTYFRWYQKLSFLLSMKLSNVVVCNSRNTLSSLPAAIKRLAAADSLCVIYNGVDVNKIARRMIKSYASSSFRIVMVARLVPQKDHALALEALSILLKKGLDVQLDIIGTGPLQDELAIQCSELGLSDYVHFRGFMQRQEIYDNLASYDCFIVASKWEGFCNAMVEAMVAGVPVIANNISPLPEVAGEQNAIFFKRGSSQDLASRIESLISDVELAKKLSKAAARFASERYSLGNSSSAYLQLYTSSAI